MQVQPVPLYDMLSFMEVTSYDFAFSRRKVLKQKIFLITCIFILVLIGLQLLFRFIICPVSVSSSSMAPGIEKNAALFIIPLGTGRPDFFNVKSVKRGEIVRIASAFPSEKNFFQKSAGFIVSMLTFRRIRPFYRRRSVPVDLNTWVKACSASSGFRAIRSTWTIISRI